MPSIINFLACLFDNGYNKLYPDPNSLSVPVKKSVNAVISLVKMTNLSSRLDTSRLLLDACSVILSNHFYFYDYPASERIENGKLLLEALDAFLLTFLNDDEEMLNDFKREWFTDVNKKLYISFPLEFLKKQLSYMSTTGEGHLSLWILKVDNFFAWICPSDERLKEEFWNSEEALAAKNRLANNEDCY